MPGIDPSVTVHRLNIDPNFKPVKQKRRTFNAERYMAINTEVDKLLKADFIEEANYPDWIANVVLVKKANGNWRVCVDFTDLNRACPKDSFPLPRIDQLVDATAGRELLSFMDAYSGYNQIRMHEGDQEHTAFLTNQGLYCYKVMPFGLKNAGATYQRLVNKMFKDQIGKMMEVYVDDMLVKSLKMEEHIQNLRETFEILRRYKMKLNPSKCAFGQVFQKPEASGRLAKWSIELGEFDIQFKPRTAIKGQALADFIAEFTYTPEIPDGVKLSCAVRFKFKATNNQAEYEALLSGLRLAKEVSARHLTIYSDSQLVVSQVNSEFQAKGEKMASYLEKAKEAMNQFDTVTIIQVPRAENTNADALARLATGLEERLLKTVPIEILEAPSIDKKEQVGSIVVRPCWMDPITSFLRDGTLPADKFEARRLRFRSARYFLDKGKLYKKGFSSPSLLCLDEDRGKFTLEEVHAGVCGNHSSGRTLAHRILRQGYYWPTIQTDSLDFVRKCDKCQRFSAIPRQAPEDLTTVTSPWPFAKWGIDLIGPLPTARGQFKYAVVAIDYYTKWKVFSSPAHPKSNGQVEAVNKTIKQTLKKKLEKSKGAWVDELPLVLWAYRTSFRAATGETPFSLAYGVEAVIPIEISLPTFRVDNFDEENNAVLLALATDLLEEKREISQVRAAALQQTIARYYNSKVKLRRFVKGDLVLRKVFLNTKEKGVGVLGPNWEGPYRVRAIIPQEPMS
ncbi:hypothetical protein UlMin_026485 [Ulmus minor]